MPSVKFTNTCKYWLRRTGDSQRRIWFWSIEQLGRGCRHVHCLLTFYIKYCKYNVHVAGWRQIWNGDTLVLLSSAADLWINRGLRCVCGSDRGIIDDSRWEFANSAHLARARPWRSSSIDFRTRQRHRHWYSSFTSARRWRVVVRRPIENLSNECAICNTTAAFTVKPGTHRRQNRPSWRQCRPRQAVEFKLLPICRQNRQQSRPYRRQSTLSPVCTGF